MNEHIGTAGGPGMDEAAGLDDGTPMRAADAAVIMQDAGQKARQQLQVSHRVTFTVWGLALLLGYGAMWLGVRGQHPFHGPDPAAFATVTLLAVAAAIATVAADLLLTGRHITAAEALSIGLIGHVVPDGRALGQALEIAGMIASNGPVAVRAILRVMRETEGMAENEAFALEARAGMAVFASEDAKEGPRAFAEKRRPQFRDH